MNRNQHHHSQHRSASRTVSEEVWSRAIHAVKVQKMSLRQAAQLYGVHHMSLHRRVRGRYPTHSSQSPLSNAASTATTSTSTTITSCSPLPQPPPPPLPPPLPPSTSTSSAMSLANLLPSAATTFDMRSFLTEDDEGEILGILREQFLHEKHITSDGIRFVVRAIASRGGTRALYPEFPPQQWVVEFKRAHGFDKLNRYAYPPSSTAVISCANNTDNHEEVERFGEDRDAEDNEEDGSMEDEEANSESWSRQQQQQQSKHKNVSDMPLLRLRDYTPFKAAYHDDFYYDNSHRRKGETSQQVQLQPPPPQPLSFQQQHQNWWEKNSDHTSLVDRDEEFSNNGTTSNSGSNSSSGDSYENGGDNGPTNIRMNTNDTSNGMGLSSSNTSTTGSANGNSSERQRDYKLSHTVPPETWEKAIAAVERQGMSLRAAAKIYGVHFAALHRRVKKRASGDKSPTVEGYLHPDDEAGIIRVIVARAELGVLMTYDEMLDLIQRTALRNMPDFSVEAARTLMERFQARNEHSIRHIIVNWPPSLRTSFKDGNTAAIDGKTTTRNGYNGTLYRSALRMPPHPRVTMANLSATSPPRLPPPSLSSSPPSSPSSVLLRAPQSARNHHHAANGF